MASEYRSDKLTNALRTLHRVVEGIKASVIVNYDGLLVSSYPPNDDDDPTRNPANVQSVAAMSGTLIGLAERTMGRLAQGDLQRLLMEGEEGMMLVFPSGRASLAVLCAKDVRLAHVLYAARRTAQEIAVILSE